MSSGITLSAATRQNLLSLQDTANLLATTQTRLSTGKKVNSALDNPTNFFTSQSLTSRSNDLSGLLDGISNGVQAIQSANQGITSIQKLVDSAKSTANQALADKSASSSGTPATKAALTANVGYQATSGAGTDGTHDYSTGIGTVFTLNDGTNTSTITLNNETLKGVVSDTKKVSADDIVKAINNQLANGGTTAAQVTASVGADGRIAFASTATGSTAEVTLTNTTANNTVDIGYGTAVAAMTATGADAKSGASAAIASGTAIGATIDLSGANTAAFDIQLGSGPKKTITVAGGGTPAATTQAEILTSINDQLDADTGFAGKVTASFVDNKLTFTTVGTGSSEKITIDNSAGGNTDLGFGVAGASTKAVVATGGGSTGSTNKTRESLAKQFNEILNQITQQAKDSSYNGVNLLWRSGADPTENTLRVTFNENGSSNLDIQGVKFDAEGLGFKQIEGGFQSDDEIKTALSAITTATSSLRAQSSTFGSNLSVVQNRQDFSKNLINILDTGSANLTNADLNQEAANSQALSTRNSLAISALSLANQAQQGILQLLR